MAGTAFFFCDALITPAISVLGAVEGLEVLDPDAQRFVIPVKTEQRKRVNGVIHGASSSGQTVFIEPLETIEQNNDLVRLLEEEQAEIRRILKEMTARIGEQSEAILREVGYGDAEIGRLRAKGILAGPDAVPDREARA